MSNKHYPEDNSDTDLTLFEQAMQESLGNKHQKSEIEVLREVLRNLAEQFGGNIVLFNGAQLGQRMSLNFRLEDFQIRLSLSTEAVIAIQENNFTKEFADEILSKIMNEEKLFLDSTDDLEKNLNVILSILEVLLFLGQPEYENEDELVKEQKNIMISNIRSYDLMLTTFNTCAKFLDNYIQNRVLEDNKSVNLQEVFEKYIFSDLEGHKQMGLMFKGYAEARKNVLDEMHKVLELITMEEILTSELRVIVKAFDQIIKFHPKSNGTLEAVIDQKALTECVSLITRLQ